MKIFASESWLVAPVMRTQSSSEMRPLRMLLSGTPPTEDSMRVITCSDGISMLKMATEARMLGFTAAYSAMFTASVVLPIEGRPATMTRSPGAQPAGELVELREAGRQAAQRIGIGVPLVDLVDEAGQQRAHRDRAVARAEARLRDLEDLLLGHDRRDRARYGLRR